MQKLETKKTKFSTSHPYVTTIIIGVILLLVGYFLYIFPAVKKSNELSVKDVLQLEVELGRRQTRLFSIKKIAKDFDNLPEEFNQKLNESLPSEPNRVDLLVNLDAIAKQSDLKANSIKIIDAKQAVRDDGQATKDQFDVEEINIKLNLDGITYLSLKNFIRNVEKNARLLRINEFDFGTDSQSIQFSLTAFYLEE